MRKLNSYSVLFFTRNEKINNRGKVPIYMRITINGRHVEISTKQWIEPSRWNKAGGVKGNKEDAEIINNTIEANRAKAWKTYQQLLEKYNMVTADMLKERLVNPDIDKKTLIDVFKLHNKKAFELIGIDYAPATVQKFERTMKHIEEFLKYQYNKEDIHLFELEYRFIEDFEHFIKIIKKCNHNTTTKYIQTFRKIINLAVRNDWLLKDPFSRYKSQLKEVKRDVLTFEELEILKKKVITISRLDIIRDLFLFSCYTGLAYIDVAKLTDSNIKKGVDGELWVFTERTKTKVDSNIPLLPVPLNIIEKYKDFPRLNKRNTLLPIYSNQKTNAYLKEIAAICGIDKRLTFHIARHTFSTTVTLNNGVPIESVSKMLGHKDLSTTQIYAKVVPKKVSEDMKKLKAKLYEK